LAARIGTKRAILVSLAIWSGIVVYAYFINTQIEYFTLGVVVGLVLGGSQALSRSYYGSMIPPEASAEFYGFYTVFSKFSAIWGPLQFALIDSIFDSTRLAIVSLIVFFVGGMILLALVDETQARALRAAEAS
jgi:UMF1 family MFS transporter